jgi:hypothetical protein
MIGLPESIKFMALYERHRPGMEQLIAEISPKFQAPVAAE